MRADPTNNIVLFEVVYVKGKVGAAAHEICYNRIETSKDRDERYDMKKRIMVYGDSNTHGYNAEDGSRFDENTRWTGVCQQLLGDDYVIVEEGLNGRNTCHSFPDDPYKNGIAYIIPCVLSQLPLDMICVKLGSNDFDPLLDPDPVKIAERAAQILKIAKMANDEKYPGRPCKYVLMAPLKATEDALTGDFAEYYDRSTVELSWEAPEAFAKQAEKDGFLYFDANEVAVCCKKDGVHLDVANHKKLGIAMAVWIKEQMEG